MYLPIIFYIAKKKFEIFHFMFYINEEGFTLISVFDIDFLFFQVFSGFLFIEKKEIK